MSIISAVIESEIADVAAKSSEIDCLIIGSGTAGVTTALELAKAGLSAVILEAGPFVTPNHIGTSPLRREEALVRKVHELVRYDASWVTQQEHDQAAGGPLRNDNNAWSAVGGRTIFWGGCTPRFHPDAFKGWPYGYQDLEPHYDRAEDFMSVSGASDERQPFYRSATQDHLIERMKRAGIEATHAPLCVDTAPVSNGHVSFGFDSSISRLLRSGRLVWFGSGPGVSLVSDVVVTRLDIDDNSVTAVETLDRRTGKTYALTPKRVVLAGGTIQSTRLAMVSGLDKRNPLVGHFIGDHLFQQGELKLREPLPTAPLYIFLPETEDRPFQVQLQGPFEETWYSPYHATVYLSWKADGLYVLYYCFGVGTVERDNRLVLRPAKDGEGGDRWGGMRDYCVVYDRSPQDLRTLETMADSMNAVAEQLDAEIFKTQENQPGSALHETGGLIMGTDPANSVTDPFGRVWGIDNLVVADASTWPSQGAANPYLTITAGALRNAEALLADIRA